MYGVNIFLYLCVIITLRECQNELILTITLDQHLQLTV